MDGGMNGQTAIGINALFTISVNDAMFDTRLTERRGLSLPSEKPPAESGALLVRDPG